MSAAAAFLRKKRAQNTMRTTAVKSDGTRRNGAQDRLYDLYQRTVNLQMPGNHSHAVDDAEEQNETPVHIVLEGLFVEYAG